MYNYSPIKSMHIKNFRNLGDVEIDFSKSPIVTLVGENEAGKTSVIKAFSMCALHDSPKDQKDYIRDGTKKLGIEIVLNDDTRIIRVKENGGLNLYRVVYPDGKVWDVTKLSEGLPVPVSDLMGLITEPETGEYLNVRTYEDKLLFVVTPNSTNYKVMYNALKVEQLTKAIKNGSNEVNALKQQINVNESSVKTLYDQLRTIEVIDVQPLVAIRNRVSEYMVSLAKLEELTKLNDELKEIEHKLGALELLNIYKDVKPIDEGLAVKLNNAINALNNLSMTINESQKYSELSTLNEIDMNNYNKAINIMALYNGLSQISNKALLLQPVNSLEQISESLVVQLNSSFGIVDKLRAIETKLGIIDVSSLSEIDTKKLSYIDTIKNVIQQISENKQRDEYLKQYAVYIGQIQTYLKQCGVAVETCPKCGEDIVFDLDKMK